MEIKEFIKKFAGQFDETEPEVFTAETPFRNVEEWSSFIALSVMAMVYDEYKVAITGEEMREANTIQELFDIVKSHL